MAAYLISRYERNCRVPNRPANPPYHPIALPLTSDYHRLGDPLFALTIGIGASMSRILRDQREKFPEQASVIGYGAVAQLGQQRLQRWWNGDFQDL